MNKIITLFILILLICYNTFAQKAHYKPPIDTSVFGKWPSIISPPSISNNGKYAMYYIDTPEKGEKKMILISTNARWKYEISGVDGQFTNDSRKVIYIKEDSLCILTLGTTSRYFIKGIESYKLEANGNFLVYKLKKSKTALHIINLTTEKEWCFESVVNYLMSNTGKNLILTTAGQDRRESVKWIELISGKEITICEGLKVNRISLDKDESQLVITAFNLQKNNLIDYFYYKKGTNNSILLANDELNTLNRNLKITDDEIKFSNDGKRIFVFLVKNEISQYSSSIVPIHIWNYKHQKLPGEEAVNNNDRYLAIIEIETKKIIQINKENEPLSEYYNRPVGYDDNWVQVSKFETKGMERTHYLVSTSSGKSIVIPYEFKISPSSKYLIYYDDEKKNYFSYELSTGITRSITENIKVNWVDNRREVININKYTRGVAGWLQDDNAVLLYDNYDIWKVNLRGEKPPINITNGYGQRTLTIFHLGLKEYENRIINKSEVLVFSALNTVTKDNGFFQKRINQKGDPELLTLGPYIYYSPDATRTSTGSPPVKSKKTNTYIVTRMSASESPNLYSTKNFKDFIVLSACHPEKKYNWFQTELHTWDALNGNLLQGVLFKPENFDSTKQYPIIFYYYEKLSDGLHEFIYPAPSDGRLNIPWYVSNGYLVFLPDIKFIIGHPGESAVNSVVSAAEYLSLKPYVNKNKMGIQGVSFGGFLTNYIMTHTNIFAAASTSAGGSDFISYYGDLHSNKFSQQQQFESGQYRIGSSLLEQPELYIENSPIFKVKDVTCPVLIFHTTNDITVPFRQAVELFTGLKRAGKKVWMLQYDDGNHAVWGKSADDFTTRLQQFFDHYLKDVPAPKWMTTEKIANWENTMDGFQLDSSGTIP
jgi:dienelactone hydrolase